MPSTLSPNFILTLNGDILAEDTPENREIVRRIHACVQACEGLSTDELEQGIVREMRNAIGDVIPLLEKRRPIDDGRFESNTDTPWAGSTTLRLHE